MKFFVGVLLILYCDYVFSERDFTQENVNFYAISGIANSSSYCCCPSFARGWPLILTTTKRAWKMHFWDPSQWDKMCFECQRIKFQWKKIKIFTFAYSQGRGGWPPPLMASLTLKYLFVFLTTPMLCKPSLTLHRTCQRPYRDLSKFFQGFVKVNRCIC